MKYLKRTGVYDMIWDRRSVGDFRKERHILSAAHRKLCHSRVGKNRKRRL